MRLGSRLMSLGIYQFGLVLLLVLVLLGTGSAAESEVSYEGKAVRIIVPVSPGGGLDLQSRTLASVLRKYIPGNPPIIVQNVPGAGGIIAANHFVGLGTPDRTILQCHIGHPLYQLLGHEVKYDVRRWHFLGGTRRPFMPIVQRPDLPYRSISQWSQATSPIVWSADTHGSTVENPARIMRLAGARIKIVTGYAGSTPRVAAVLRGEADATPETLATARPHLDAGRLIVVGRLLPPEIPGYPNAPYVLNAFTFTDEQKTLYGVAEAAWHLQTCWLLREDAPQPAVRVLQEAIRQAILSTEYASAMDRMQLGGNYMSPAEIMQDFVKPQLGIPAHLQETFRKIALSK